MMHVFETFSGLGGIYMLTHEGQLGVFDQNKKFNVDTKLTNAFLAYNQKYLQSYLADPRQDNFHLAVICRLEKPRPWGLETMLLQKSVVQRLYPLGGAATKQLTEFQKRNQEKSIYRGIEVMLEYKLESTPDTPIYCPVLYDRGTMLNEYVSVLERAESERDSHTPVIEVINLLASFSMGRRYTPEIQELRENIRQGAIKTGLRRSSIFSVLGETARESGSATAGDVYAHVDKRTDRRVTLEISNSSSPVKSNTYFIKNLGVNNLGLSLEKRSDPIDAAALRGFTKFRELDPQKLGVLASRTFVYHAPSGTSLLERGANDTWHLYLLSGKVNLYAADGGMKVIESGTDAAKNPISSLKPRMYTVTAAGHVDFLWIDDGLVDDIVKGKISL